MFETYRMLGSAHETELERMAASPRPGAVAPTRRRLRLSKRVSRLRLGRVVGVDQNQGIAGPNTGDAPVSAAPLAP